jgi:predicted Holliday junction resolvase-like endonuclease
MKVFNMINSVDLLLLLLGIFIGAAISIILTHTQNRIIRQTMSREIENAFKARADAERSRIVRIYEGKLQDIKEQLKNAVVTARRESTNQSRAVLKGKMAEQIAPLLPGFDYWPADARFLGDPVDYVVFNGYSACKDRFEDCDNLEVVILDIKQGKSGLTYGQRQIAQAITEGRVRFEVVRVHANGDIHIQTWGTSPGEDQDVALGTYDVRNIDE